MKLILEKNFLIYILIFDFGEYDKIWFWFGYDDYKNMLICVIWFYVELILIIVGYVLGVDVDNYESKYEFGENVVVRIIVEKLLGRLLLVKVIFGEIINMKMNVVYSL